MVSSSVSYAEKLVGSSPPPATRLDTSQGFLTLPDVSKMRRSLS